MPTKYALSQGFLGYYSKSDPSVTDPRYLVSGSQNVLVNEQNLIEGRGGITIYGAASTSTNPVISEFVWNDSSANEWALRSSSTILEVYIGTVEGTANNAWETLDSGYTANAKFYFDKWWSSTETLDILLFVYNTSTLSEWSGGATRYSSATTNTITKSGSGTWVAARFLTAGTRQIRMKDSGGTWRTFTYTGGESTTTLTGVTPDPTGFTFTSGALVLQEVRDNSNTPASGYTNNFIRVLNNQIYVGSATQRTVRVSKNTSITDYSFSSPRAQGEGATLTLDGEIVGFAPQESDMYIFAGKDSVFKTDFVLLDSSGLKETLGVKKLKTGALQGAFSQDMITNIGNSICYLSNEPKLYILDRIENIQVPNLQDVSDPIKPDFDAAIFTNGTIKSHLNRVYVSAPTDGNVFILETRKDAEGNLRRFWQPPQIFWFRQFSIIAGDIYGHSSLTTETYKLFDGVNDLSNPIEFKARFAYNNFGNRTALKKFDEYFSEMYLSTNAEITLTIDYDFEGATSIQEFSILGSNTKIAFESAVDASLGINSLGTNPLGTYLDAPSSLVKIRSINETRPIAFQEIGVTYSTTDDDVTFKLLAHGPNVTLSPIRPFYLAS